MSMLTSGQVAPCAILFGGYEQVKRSSDPLNRRRDGFRIEPDIPSDLSFYLDTLTKDFESLLCFARSSGDWQEKNIGEGHRQPTRPKDVDAVHSGNTVYIP